jgi:hypothetical protein
VINTPYERKINNLQKGHLDESPKSTYVSIFVHGGELIKIKDKINAFNNRKLTNF